MRHREEGQGAQFIAELLAARTDDERRDVVARWAGCTLYLPAPKADDTGPVEQRIQAARVQLAAGQPGTDVVRLLAERFGCSAPTARRAVALARSRL